MFRRSKPPLSPLDPDLYVTDPGLHIVIDVGLDADLELGRGTSFFMTGRCWHDEHTVVGLEWWTFPDRVAVDIEWVGLRRSDHAVLPTDDADPRRDAQVGFAGLIDVAGVPVDTPAMFIVRAIYDDGTSGAATVGHHMRRAPSTLPHRIPTRRARTTILLPTFEPRPDLFARQIASIANQLADDWNCIVVDDGSAPWSFEQILATVGDDDRFVVMRHEDRLGYYRNFERALHYVPADAELVALSDQDDVWHEDKLLKLEKHLQDGVMLVCSDSRVVTDVGDVLAETFYEGREFGASDLASLVISNTIPSASMLFRRELLDLALPFPPVVGARYHDHWLAIVSRAVGAIAFVDEPLYDYVQHGANAVGWGASATKATPTFGDRVADAVDAFSNARKWYFADTMRVRQLARTALLRADHLAPADRRVLVGLSRLAPDFEGVVDAARRARTLPTRAGLVLEWEGRVLWGVVRASADRARMRLGLRPISWDGLGDYSATVHEPATAPVAETDDTSVFVRGTDPVRRDAAGDLWFSRGAYVAGSPTRA